MALTLGEDWLLSYLCSLFWVCYKEGFKIQRTKETFGYISFQGCLEFWFWISSKGKYAVGLVLPTELMRGSDILTRCGLTEGPRVYPWNLYWNSGSFYSVSWLLDGSGVTDVLYHIIQVGALSQVQMECSKEMLPCTKTCKPMIQSKHFHLLNWSS